MTYVGNDSSRYDRKDYLEKITKLKRVEAAEGELRVGEKVTIKTKSRVWKAIVKDPHPTEHRGRGKKRKHDGSDAFKSPEVPIQARDMFLGSFTPANDCLEDVLEQVSSSSEEDVMEGTHSDEIEQEMDRLTEFILADDCDKQAQPPADQNNPHFTEEAPSKLPSVSLLDDCNISALLNCCDLQFTAKDDFNSFKTEVRQQLQNITELLKTLITQGKQLKSMLSPSMPTPLLYTPQFQECMSYQPATEHALQDIGVDLSDKCHSSLWRIQQQNHCHPPQ